MVIAEFWSIVCVLVTVFDDRISVIQYWVIQIDDTGIVDDCIIVVIALCLWIQSENL